MLRRFKIDGEPGGFRDHQERAMDTEPPERDLDDAPAERICHNCDGSGEDRNGYRCHVCGGSGTVPVEGER